MRFIKFMVFVIAACAALAAMAPPSEAVIRRTGKLPFPVTASTDIKYVNAEAVLDKDFEITLDGNQAAGWMWSLYGSLPQGMTMMSQNFVPGPTPAPQPQQDNGTQDGGAPKPKQPVGIPGKLHLTYRASRTGASHFYMQCQKPGEPTPTLYAVINVKVRLP